MTEEIRILMCAPHHYDVDYVINPWMEGNIHKSSRDRAAEQWEKLYKILKEHALVDLVEPQKGWPDMVFTANAGVVLGNVAVVSRFYHKERQGEEPYFKQWFEQQGFTVYELPKDLPFEGAGDALLDRDGRWLWAGYGFRSELDSHAYLAKWLDIEVVSLQLVDDRFYHLDTCFCPLTGGYLLYYPPAFDFYSNRIIEMRVPPEKRIAIGEADAVKFACNRDGYVQALLGGNAIAVHDIEQAMMGTSLGVDMKRGVAVRGGHRHHLKVINSIRRCGNIAAAVEAGVITKADN